MQLDAVMPGCEDAAVDARTTLRRSTWPIDIGHDRLNPTGGTIARGHAYGATGAILILEAVEELERRGGRYGVAAVSGAAGLGAAVLIERM